MSRVAAALVMPNTQRVGITIPRAALDSEEEKPSDPKKGSGAPENVRKMEEQSLHHSDYTGIFLGVAALALVFYAFK